MAGVENTPERWKPEEGESGDAFILHFHSLDHWRLYYRYRFALDIVLQDEDYFILADASRNSIRFDSMMDAPELAPRHLDIIPDMTRLLIAFAHDLPTIFANQQQRLRQRIGVLSPCDLQADILPTKDGLIMGNVGADAWILREAMARILKSIHAHTEK